MLLANYEDEEDDNEELDEQEERRGTNSNAGLQHETPKIFLTSQGREQRSYQSDLNKGSLLESYKQSKVANSHVVYQASLTTPAIYKEHQQYKKELEKS